MSDPVMFTREYWREMRRRLGDQFSEDVVEEGILPFFYFSLDEYRWKTHQHVMGCFRKSARQRTKYYLELVERVWHPLVLHNMKNEGQVRLALFDNRSSPAKSVAYWSKIIDKWVSLLTLEEMEMVMNEPLVSPAPLYILHFFAWKHMKFVSGKHPFPVIRYPLDQDTSKLKETWGAEETSFEKVGLLTDVVMTYSDGKNQCVVPDCKIVFSDGKFPGQARSMLLVRYKNLLRTYMLDKLPPDLRVFIKPEVDRSTESFECEWEENQVSFNLKQHNQHAHRCFPWDTEVMDLILMTYRDPDKQYNTRNIRVFRLLSKENEIWRVRNPDHKEENINIYDYVHPTFYKVDVQSLEDQKNEFLKLTCTAIPGRNESAQFIHQFEIEMDIPMEKLLMPKLIECSQMGWLGRDLICDHGKVSIFSFQIPIEGRRRLIRRIALKLSSLVPPGFGVSSRDEGHAKTVLIVKSLG